MGCPNKQDADADADAEANADEGVCHVAAPKAVSAAKFKENEAMQKKEQLLVHLAAGGNSPRLGYQAAWATRQHGSLMAAANVICDLCFSVFAAQFPWKTLARKLQQASRILCQALGYGNDKALQMEHSADGRDLQHAAC